MAQPLAHPLLALHADAGYAAEPEEPPAGTAVAPSPYMQTGDWVAQWRRRRSIAMQARPPRVLAAHTGAVVRQLRAALGAEVHVITARTLDEAVRSLHAEEPHLIVVGYHFDELRPFRFIQYAREHLAGSHVPIVLVRALPMHLGATTESQLREAYHTLGVDLVLNLFDDTQRDGYAATVDRLRRLLRGLLAL